jgi:hypothetical protein
MNATLTFPQVAGRNLLRQTVNFPQDLPERYTIVMIAFQQYQQADVDTWLPFARVLEKLYRETAYIELPVIFRMGWLGQTWLDETMRAGIPDPLARERTVTLYLDKPDFRSKLGIHSEDAIQVLLVNRQGEVLWRQSGRFSAEKGRSLGKALGALTSTVADRQAA